MRIFEFSKNKLTIGRALIIFLGIVIFSLFSLGFFQDAKSPYVLAQSASSPDAIAIRVIPNPEHQSVARWYSEQGFEGSPQGLTIDGYEAIRDGRTVYVNAANITGANLYTNIYLISYNQDADENTMGILDQIISHWKFNTNETDPGHCGQTTTVCLIDADCPAGQYCNSLKAKITRDTKRLGGLADMKIAIENYKRSKTYYPKLTAGTYLANKTISTWPSWQQTLAKDLGTGLPVDPINKLGDCPGYDPITCWKEANKSFAGTTLADGTLNLPAGSNAFVYTSAFNGSNYNICGIMESGFITTLAAGACAGSAVSYSDVAKNNNPVITCGTLVGSPGKAFEGYVSAGDSDGDPLSAWTMATIGTWTGWVGGPSLQDTANANQKKIFATKSGNNGNYNFSVAVNDNRGGTANKDCTIKIMSVTPTCSTNGACDGICPANCTAAQDQDCGGAGCYGNKKCEPVIDCAIGPNDCTPAECCGNGNCDSARGENTTSCSSDCHSAVNNCLFNITFPCLLQ